MNKKNFTTALVTGASSGIGRSYALEIAKRYRCNLILTARRHDRLETLKSEIDEFYRQNEITGRSVHVMPSDLSSSESISSLIDSIEAAGIELDLLVNNAGFGTVKAFVDTIEEQQRSMVEVNCRGPLQLIHHFFPKMLGHRRGSIINVCSTCSFQPMPLMATYGATKAFLYSLSTALAAEGAANGVQVMAHCPGPTESEFHLVSGLPKKLTYVPGMKAKAVVTQALNALDADRTVVINGWLNYGLSYLSKWLPTSVSTKIVRWILLSSA